MSNNDRTSRGGTRLLHCGIPVPSMTAMGQKQTSRRHLANLRFASQSRHARVASRSPAQKLYILHKKLSLSGALCAKPAMREAATAAFAKSWGGNGAALPVARVLARRRGRKTS